jgi:hypothetical protein
MIQGKKLLCAKLISERQVIKEHKYMSVHEMGCLKLQLTRIKRTCRIVNGVVHIRKL